jgi:hypothetical protein
MDQDPNLKGPIDCGPTRRPPSHTPGTQGYPLPEAPPPPEPYAARYGHPELAYPLGQ